MADEPPKQGPTTRVATDTIAWRKDRGTSVPTRRTVLKTAALMTTALAALFVRGAHAAGKLSVGFWDHWVPGGRCAAARHADTVDRNRHTESDGALTPGIYCTIELRISRKTPSLSVPAGRSALSSGNAVCDQAVTLG
jgi:hypothetical protein